jgi:hypothetical protein
MIDSDIFIYEKRTKLVIADPSERKKGAAIGPRKLMRESKLSQAPISNAIRVNRFVPEPFRSFARRQPESQPQ